VTFPHRIAGLDLSLTATGIVTYAGGDLTARTVGGTVRGSDLEAAHRRLQTILTAIADLRHYDLVVIEDGFVAGSGDTTKKLSGLHWLVRHWLWLRGIPYVLVNVAHVKQYAVGKGSGSGTDKDSVVLAVARRYGHLVTVMNNNEADALVLAAIALDSYGVPLVDVPATHRRALAKVTGWPALKGAEAYRA